METINIIFNPITINLKNMATLQQFQDVLSRIDAATQQIINNQGISGSEEDQLLAQLEEHATELESVGQTPTEPQEPETPPVIQPEEPNINPNQPVPPVVNSEFPVNPENPTNPDQL